MKKCIIKTRTNLSKAELEACHSLNAACREVDGTYRQPYLSNMLNFDKDMPAFLLAYQDERLLGLLAIYADDREELAEVSLMVRPDVRGKGIASQLLDQFYLIQEEHKLLGPLFVTEQVFLQQNPNFLENMELVAEEEKEIWLSRERKAFKEVYLPDMECLLATADDIEAIAQFQSQTFETSLEMSIQYAKEAVYDKNSLLYIIKKGEKIFASCTVDLSTSYNYLYGLAVTEDMRGKGIGSALVKSVINDLIDRNTRKFQIAVEEENVGAWSLYKNLGFTEQTQIVYMRKK
ncbi:GNAT family N-acetyltransferase [Streptococcus ruminantium]|uniref:GNAT family N-acetyltransferase n=1 Tax=Streptococcus ruminantium TaxID=1917441 RepID=UPI0012DD0B91|nr:GNAT family N-acetyltransferase [Streptococcus ruminantium]